MRNNLISRHILYSVAEIQISELVDTFFQKVIGVTPRRKSVESKFRIAIHFILSKIINNSNDEEKCGTACVNFNKLENAIGDHVNVIVEVLLEQVFDRLGNYVPHDHSYSYQLKEGLTIKVQYLSDEEWDTSYKKESHCLERMRKLFQLDKAATITEYIARLRDTEDDIAQFVESYKDKLSKLHVNKVIEYDSYLRAKQYESPMQKYMYQCNLREYHLRAEHNLSFDGNNRIYHTLTNCPKELLQFFNIKFIKDMHNSQPLILCLLLFDYFNISHLTIQYFIYSLFNSNIYNYKYDKKIIIDSLSPFQYHYETRFGDVPKYAASLGVDPFLYDRIRTIDNVPKDVLCYFYYVMSGTLWDAFAKSGIDRKEIKTHLFQEIFYRNTNKRGRANKIYGKYGLEFQRLFPNVTQAISDIISSHPRAWLPCEMMRLEAELIRRVLRCLWQKGYDAISIHDAIVILDTGRAGVDKAQQENEVEKIFSEVYVKSDLHGKLG